MKIYVKIKQTKQIVLTIKRTVFKGGCILINESGTDIWFKRGMLA